MIATGRRRTGVPAGTHHGRGSVVLAAIGITLSVRGVIVVHVAGPGHPRRHGSPCFWSRWLRRPFPPPPPPRPSVSSEQELAAIAALAPAAGPRGVPRPPPASAGAFVADPCGSAAPAAATAAAAPGDD